VLNPTYERIFVKTENADRRVKFVTCARSKHELLQGIDKNDSCKPVLLLIKGGTIKAKIMGANAPELETLASELMPVESLDG
jgi:hypothetical protein